ncbi:MAG TPA: hypothetical protein VMI75_25830 [Polyangiaceae bacterium]|nr:hypothetical protein [Polyangiaceae bacterium]
MKTAATSMGFLLAGVIAACGGSSSGNDNGGSSGGSSSGGSSGSTSSGGGSSSSGSNSSSSGSSSGSGSGSSAGADASGSSSGGSSDGGGGTNPTHLPMPSGTCPTFANGVVTVAAGGGMIQAQTWMGTKGGGPLIIYWHATSSSATLEVPLAFDTAAVTAAGGMIVGFESTTRTGTPMNTTGNDVWYQSDVAFADQAVACAIQQVHVDPQHIHAAGYSAGALQSIYMWFARSGYVASVISYSGGDVTIDEAPFQDSGHAGAAIVAHGAPGSDVFSNVDFAMASATWETQIKQAGAMAIDCDDGQAHVYFTRLSNLAPVSLKFFQDHPFGVKPEPYTSLPSGFPSYCKID